MQDGNSYERCPCTLDLFADDNDKDMANRILDLIPNENKQSAVSLAELAHEGGRVKERNKKINDDPRDRIDVV